MDIERSCRFPFEDPAWPKKLLVATVALALPVAGWLVTGLALFGLGPLAERHSLETPLVLAAVAVFLVLQLPGLAFGGFWLECIRRTAAGETHPLPDWTDLGSHAWRGTVFGIATSALVTVAALPACLGAGLMAAGFEGRGVSDTVSPLLALFGLGLLAPGFLILIPLALLAPLMPLAYAMTGRVSALVHLRSMARGVVQNPLDYLLVLFVPGVVNMLLVTLLGATIVLVPVVWMYVSLVQAHLLGQFGRKTGWP